MDATEEPGMQQASSAAPLQPLRAGDATTSDAPAAVSRSIAPPWHTALLIVLLLATSLTGALTVRHVPPGDDHHALNYALTMGWEWALAAFVYWGLRRRGTALRQILGVRRPGARAWFEDAGAALVFWFCSMLVLALVAAALRPLHVDPEGIRKIVSKLAPATPFQMILWIGMSITAGLCEEFLFRGYLQQQFSRWTHRAWAGLLCAAIVFGIAHGYEGIAGMLLITAYGALFGVFVRMRRGLRAAMMAHAWHDSISGLALFFASHFAHHALS